MIDLFADCKKGDKDLAVLEGLHAIKHAYRFGANIEHIVSCDREGILDLALKLAPDMFDFLQTNIKEISKEDFIATFPKNFHGQIVALAKKKENRNLEGLCVWLESPSSLNNTGAVIRVLAARGVKNFVISGAEFNIWHKDALRSAAGLHFALSSINQFTESRESLDFIQSNNYMLFALDPEGRKMQRGFDLNDKACLVFGSERNGISDYIKSNSDRILKIPMQQKVSSLNLATSVAIAVYI